MASLLRDCGRYETAIEYYSQDLEHCRKNGDRWGEAWTLNSIGGAYELMGRLDEAADTLSEAYRIFYMFGDKINMSRCLHDLGITLMKGGNYESARACHIADLSVATQRGDLHGIAMAFGSLGEVAMNEDEPVTMTYLDRAAAIADAIGDTDAHASALVIKGHAKIRQGHSDGQACLTEGIRLLRKQGARRRYAQALMGASFLEKLPSDIRTEYLREAISIFGTLGDEYDGALARDAWVNLKEQEADRNVTTTDL
jgi:tetratricopeptide (TPR) repeat protein